MPQNYTKSKHTCTNLIVTLGKYLMVQLKNSSVLSYKTFNKHFMFKKKTIFFFLQFSLN